MALFLHVVGKLTPNYTEYGAAPPCCGKVEGPHPKDEKAGSSEIYIQVHDMRPLLYYPGQARLYTQIHPNFPIFN
jgi:hypothetical protein